MFHREGVRRLSALFAARRVVLFRDDVSVCFPEVAVAMTRAIGWWYAVPEFLTSSLTAVAHDICHDLARAATKSNPYPPLIALFANK